MTSYSALKLASAMMSLCDASLCFVNPSVHSVMRRMHVWLRVVSTRMPIVLHIGCLMHNMAHTLRIRNNFSQKSHPQLLDPAEIAADRDR